MNKLLLARKAALIPLAALALFGSPLRAQTAPGSDHPLQAYAEWAQLPMLAQRACSPHPAASLSLREGPALSIRNDLNLAQLQVASQKPGVRRVQLGNAQSQLALGFYDVAHKVGSSASMEGFNLPDGSKAVCVSSFDASVLSSPQIVIGNELPMGSCSRKDVLNHEMIHYDIDQKSLAALKIETSQIAANFSGVYVASTIEEAQGMANEANRLFAAVLAKRLSEIRTPLHAAHDSPQEYARESRSCNGQTRRIAFAAMGRDEFGNPLASNEPGKALPPLASALAMATRN